MNETIMLNGIKIKVVDEKNADSVLTPEELKMDKVMRKSVSDAIERAEKLGLPIVGYDEKKKKVYTRYSNGEIIYHN